MMGWQGLNSSCSGKRTSAGCCEYGNERLGSIKYREFFNQPRIWQVLKAHSVEYFFLLVWKYFSSYSRRILTNSLWICLIFIYLNTFTAIVDLGRFNNSCLKSPVSTLVDLIFLSHSFSLNKLTWRETCTAASVYLADVIFIPFIVYYAYTAV